MRRILGVEVLIMCLLVSGCGYSCQNEETDGKNTYIVGVCVDGTSYFAYGGMEINELPDDFCELGAIESSDTEETLNKEKRIIG